MKRIAFVTLLAGILLDINGCTGYVSSAPPKITAKVSPSPNAAGWNNTDVSVSFVCSGTTSAIASCPQPVLVQTEGGKQVITGTATDVAGNTATASVTLNIDKTPPVASITTPLQGQFLGASPVTVQGTIDDPLSGVATVTCNGATVTLSNSSFSCDVSLVSGQNTVTIATTDLAGNAGSSSLIVTFEVAALELAYVEDLQLVWWTPSASFTGDWNSFAAFYNPVLPPGYYSLGSYAEAITESTNAPSPAGFMLVAKDLGEGALAKPLDYLNLWNSTGQLFEPAGSFWQPIPPSGYVCLGVVAQSGHNKPDLDEIRCVRQDLTVAGQAGSAVWNSSFRCGAFGICGREAEFGARQVIAQDPYAISTGAFVGSASTTVPPSGPFRCLDARRVKGAADSLWKLGSQDVTLLVEKYGPQLQLEPGEIFLPDDAEYSLNSAKLEWGLLEDGSYSSFNLQVLGSIPTSASALMNDVNSHVKTDPYFADPAFKQWLRMPTEWGEPYITGEFGYTFWGEAVVPPGFIASGNLSRARADVRAVPWNWLFTELQFWLYYPFNGPGRVQVCIVGICYDSQLNESGRHYSDWEHVTLRILNSTRELVGVFMSEHGAGRWFVKRDFGSALSFSGTHPLVYVAKYSHAHYPTAGRHYYKSPFDIVVASGTLYDLTGGGQPYYVYQPAFYTVVSSALPGYQVREPDWVQFQGLWGQYERLKDWISVYPYTSVETGPSAPIVNDCWTNGESGPGSW